MRQKIDWSDQRMKEKSKSKDLYVANMSFEMEEEELQKLFSLCGTVRSIHMVTDPKSGLPKGCAFVHMTTAAEAKDAITTLDGTYLHNRCISVTEALPRKTVSPVEKAEPKKTQRARRPRGPRK
jgi:RNA recognition motif-containing protein